MTDRTLERLLSSLRRDVDSLQRRLTRGAQRLPGRLSPEGAAVADWNLARAVGYYWAGAGALNAPSSSLTVGHTFAGEDASILLQEAYAPTAAVEPTRRSWRRRSVDGGVTWSSWVLTRPPTLAGLAPVQGVDSYQATVAVPFPSGYFSAAPVVLVGVVGSTTVSGTLVGFAESVTIAGFTLRLKTTQGNSFGNLYNVPWHAMQA